MVMMNLCAGKEGDTDVEHRLVDTAEDGTGGTNWANGIDIQTPPRVNRWKLLCNTGSPAGADDDPAEGVGGDSKGSKYIHNYDWFMLLYNRNQHSIVKCHPPITKNKTKNSLPLPKKKKNRPFKFLYRVSLPLYTPTLQCTTPPLSQVDSGISIGIQSALVDLMRNHGGWF